jgi:hypothetical protein
MTWYHVPQTETASQAQVPYCFRPLRLSTDMVDLHWLKSAPESLGFTPYWPVGCSLMSRLYSPFSMVDPQLSSMPNPSSGGADGCA